MTVADPMRPKALARLRAGLVTVLTTTRLSHQDRPMAVMARVDSTRSDRRTGYIVDLVNDDWSCTCNAGNAGLPCPHVLAVKMVTGYWRAT